MKLLFAISALVLATSAKDSILTQLKQLEDAPVDKNSSKYCYLRYCNWKTNSDLPKAFCGGKPCKTDV